MSEISNAEPLEMNDSPCVLVNESGNDLPMRALYHRIQKLYAHINEENTEVCVVLTTDEAMRELNKEWRALDETTDVLAFPMREGESEEIAKQLPLGDIVISVPAAMRYVQSSDHKERINDGENPLCDHWSLLDELTFLAIHGTLHLLGFDHDSDDAELAMREKEKSCMSFILAQNLSDTTP
jgi:probable rRNA maturation factor